MFSINTISDFIEMQDLVCFNLIEEAGNIIPVFNLCFVTKNAKILKYIKENNPINILAGQDKNNVIPIELLPATLEFSHISSSQLKILIAGVLNVPDYAIQSNMKISENVSAATEIISVASNYFKTSRSNINGSIDSQRWIQPAISDRDYINEIWLHMDLGNSFPILGISSYGEFILHDVRTLLGNDVAWKFSNKESNDKKNIVYDGTPVTKLNNGMMNSIFGYQQNKQIINAETGEQSSINASNSILMVHNTFNASSKITSNRLGHRVLTLNTHTNYWQSYLNNVTNLGLFSALIVDLTIVGKFYPIRILDKVSFFQPEIGKIYASEQEGGIYIVARVARNVANSVHLTQVRLCRENFNR
jgi:hypothetical protein